MRSRRKSKPTAKQRAFLAAIKRTRGSLKQGPGEKPFAQAWSEYKASEKAIEDRLDRSFPTR